MAVGQGARASERSQGGAGLQRRARWDREPVGVGTAIDKSKAGTAAQNEWDDGVILTTVYSL